MIEYGGISEGYLGQPPPLPKHVHAELVAQNFIQTAFEQLQG